MMTLSRPPTEQELQTNIAFFEQQVATYVAEKKSGSRELAMADLCQVMMSLNEFVYIE